MDQTTSKTKKEQLEEQNGLDWIELLRFKFEGFLEEEGREQREDGTPDLTNEVSAQNWLCQKKRIYRQNTRVKAKTIKISGWCLTRS